MVNSPSGDHVALLIMGSRGPSHASASVLWSFLNCLVFLPFFITLKTSLSFSLKILLTDNQKFSNKKSTEHRLYLFRIVAKSGLEHLYYNVMNHSFVSPKWDFTFPKSVDICRYFNLPVQFSDNAIYSTPHNLLRIYKYNLCWWISIKNCLDVETKKQNNFKFTMIISGCQFG